MTEEKKAPKLGKDAEKVMELVEGMTVVELNDLVKALEEKFGVTAAAPVAVAGPAAGAAAAPVEEQTEFNVVLAETGAEKIKVIKVVREITGLGLKEAKDLVDSAPKAIKEAVSKQEAEEIAAKFKETGAKIEIK